MTTILMLMFIVVAIYSTQLKSPMKLSMLLMVSSGGMFSYASVKTGTTWFPSLMFLMFMGGILMMFMILCAVLPNEKDGKAVIGLGSITSCFVTYHATESGPLNMLPHSTMKEVLFSNLMFMIMLALITIYFLSVMNLIKNMKSPLRLTLPCQSNN